MKRRRYVGYCLVQLAYPACVLMGMLSGQRFGYTNDLLCLTAVTAVSWYLAGKIRLTETDSYLAAGGLLLSIAHALAVLLQIFRWYAGIAAVCLIVSGWLVFDRMPRGIFRGLLHILTLFLTLLLLLVIPLWMLFSTLGGVQTLQKLDSPDGRYQARFLSLDQGALGGATRVEVLDRKKTVYLLFGSFRSSRILWEGNWGEEPEIFWENEKILSIDGTNGSVDNEDTPWLYAVSQVLDTPIRDGQVLHFEDTHGGFHGDGHTFVKLRGKIQPADPRFWHPLPASENIDKAMALSGQIPAVETGWYYFYDRHSQSLDPASADALHQRSSWNFTLAVYDAETGTVYYYKLDT